MIKGQMDGLQVLKGGQGKATIYFTKEVMHGALDLNEAPVMIGHELNQPVDSDELLRDTATANLLLRVANEILAPHGLVSVIQTVKKEEGEKLLKDESGVEDIVPAY